MGGRRQHFGEVCTSGHIVWLEFRSSFWGGTLYRRLTELHLLQPGDRYGVSRGGDSSLVRIPWVSTEGVDVGLQGFSKKVKFQLRPE